MPATQFNLKANYPAEFMAASMTYDMNNNVFVEARLQLEEGNLRITTESIEELDAVIGRANKWWNFA